MKLKSLLLAGALAFVAGSGSVGLVAANASPITYVGDYGPTLKLTITTDGVMGDINGHILDYDVKSSVFLGGDLDYSNSDVFFMDGSFEGTGPSITASPQGLSYDFGGSLYAINFEGETTNNADENMLIDGAGLYIVDSPNFEGGTLIAENGPTVIASPLTSAAPEPSSWALMMFGLAGIGLSLRWARTKRGLCFGRVLSA